MYFSRVKKSNVLCKKVGCTDCFLSLQGTSVLWHHIQRSPWWSGHWFKVYESLFNLQTSEGAFDPSQLQQQWNWGYGDWWLCFNNFKHYDGIQCQQISHWWTSRWWGLLWQACSQSFRKWHLYPTTLLRVWFHDECSWRRNWQQLLAYNLSNYTWVFIGTFLFIIITSILGPNWFIFCTFTILYHYNKDSWEELKKTT